MMSDSLLFICSEVIENGRRPSVGDSFIYMFLLKEGFMVGLQHTTADASLVSTSTVSINDGPKR